MIFIELINLFIGHLCNSHYLKLVFFYSLFLIHLFQKIYVSRQFLELFFNQGSLLTFFESNLLFLLKICKINNDQDLDFFHEYFQMSFSIPMTKMEVFCRLKYKI